MSFVHPAFLWGLLLIGIPVAVHLFHFRKYRTLYFSDTHFLQALQAENKRQSNLRKRLILSLRILTVICIVLAFAQPFRNKGTDAFHSGSAHIQIYVDNSFSMENASAEGNLLNEAKNKALDIVDAFGESDAFMLLTNDKEGRHSRFLSKSDIKKEIAALQTSPCSQSLDEMMRYGFRCLSTGKGKNRQLFLLSDFQQSTCPLTQLPTDTTVLVHFVPLHAATADNLFVDSCWFESPLFLSGQECRLRAVLRHSGRNDLEKVPVKLFVNGRQKAIATADIKAGGRALLDLTFTPEGEGLQQAWIELTDYPVTFDDRFYFSFRTRNRLPVCCICGGKENPYLNALFADDPAIAYLNMPLQQLDYSQLENQRLLILDQMENAGSGCLQALREYVENGGNLLLVPGKQADKALQNEANRTFGLGAFTRLDTQRSKVADIRWEHRLYAEAMDAPAENMDMPVVYKHYRCENTLGAGKESLLRLENGDDFLSVQHLGSGCVYLLSAPIDEVFTTFPRHALFVPSLYNMALFTNEPTRICHTIGSNEPVPVEKDALSPEELPTLRNGNGSFSCIPELRRTYNQCDLFVHDQIREAGNYLLCQRDTAVSAIAFNYDRRESELEYWQPNDMKKYCRNTRNTQVLNARRLTMGTLAEQAGTARKAQGGWLWAALLLLAAETFLLRLWKEH
ncbi:MAG: BatA domain-containing protein [Bacteroidales bacterium]|nr:BatA domain-containing protein [Bacteroidales bacterium]